MDFADISKLAATECAVTLIQSMVITQEPLRLQSGTVARCAASCLIRPQVGDRVLFGKYAGTQIKVDGEDLLVLKEEEIFAVIEN